MYKIYSRPRIRIPKLIKLKYNPHYNNNMDYKKIRKIKKMMPFIFTLVIAFITMKIVLGAIMPIFDILCTNKAESIATIVSNEEATNIMKEHSYDELFSVEKDENNNIKMIKANVISINEITSDIAIRIQNTINSRGRENIRIALGSFSGFKLLAGRGPGVKILISSTGNVETDLKSEFSSQGINQTMHRVYLQVKCRMNILTPFDNIEKEITNQILLAENIIVGNIPSNYYNFEGMNDMNDALEIME